MNFQIGVKIAQNVPWGRNFDGILFENCFVCEIGHNEDAGFKISIFWKILFSSCDLLFNPDLWCIIFWISNFVSLNLDFILYPEILEFSKKVSSLTGIISFSMISWKIKFLNFIVFPLFYVPPWNFVRYFNFDNIQKHDIFLVVISEIWQFSSCDNCWCHSSFWIFTHSQFHNSTPDFQTSTWIFEKFLNTVYHDQEYLFSHISKIMWLIAIHQMAKIMRLLIISLIRIFDH